VECDTSIKTYLGVLNIQNKRIPCGTLSEPAFKTFFFTVHLIPLAKGRKKQKLTKLACCV